VFLSFYESAFQRSFAQRFNFFMFLGEGWLSVFNFFVFLSFAEAQRFRVVFCVFEFCKVRGGSNPHVQFLYMFLSFAQ